MSLDDKNLNKGATMIEYALIAGLIAIVAIGSITSLGKHVVSSKMDYIATSLGAKTSTDQSGGGTDGSISGGAGGSGGDNVGDSGGDDVGDSGGDDAVDSSGDDAVDSSSGYTDSSY